MKNIKRFIVLMLVFAVCATMLASCTSQKENVIATYGGNYIYEDDADFSDLYHLFAYLHKMESTEDEMTTSEYNAILREAVQCTVEMRLLEDEAERRGYSIDMLQVGKEAYEDRQVFESAYPGGFEAFCDDWDVSESVFFVFNKYEALQELAMENFVSIKKVKEEEALAYYEKNKDDFIKKPQYEIKELFLQVTEDSSKEAVLADALIYIGILNSGRDWDFVLSRASMKYNLENGMIFSHYLTGSEFIEKSELEENGNMLSILEIAEEFKQKCGAYYTEMFPDGFEAYIKANEIEAGSAEYKTLFEAHMTYCSDMYKYARNTVIIENWQTGKAYALPIYHGGFESYVVIYFSSVEDEEDEVSFEDAKEEIIELITEERREKAFGDFISTKMNEANVQIKYDS